MKIKNQRIVIVVNSMQPGGAERSALKLATTLALNNDVKLFTWNEDIPDHYTVPESLQRVHVGNIFHYQKHYEFEERVSWRIRLLISKVKRLKIMRELILSFKPNIVIAFESLIGVVTFLSLLGSGCPIIISERNNPNSTIYKPHKLATQFRPLVYRLGATCTVQTEGFARWCLLNWRVKAHVTPNFLLEEEYRSVSYRSPELRFVALGRFDSQKDYVNLLMAWKEVEALSSLATLEIYGAGDFSIYESIRDKAKLVRVNFNPATKDTKSVLNKAFCLVSSSKFEGFPNVVLEAMAQRVPVISTRSSDIVEYLADRGGLLAVNVGDSAELFKKILELINNMHMGIGERGFEVSREFSWNKVEKTWAQAIEDAIKREKSKNVLSRAIDALASKTYNLIR